jgi:hypothetical protein
MEEPASMGQVIGPVVGPLQVVRDCLSKFLGESLVTRTGRTPSGKHRPRLAAQQKHFIDRAVQNLSDLEAGQSRVAVQNDDNALIVSEHLKVGYDACRGWPSRGSVNQLDALSVFPGQVDGGTGGAYHGPDRFHSMMRHTVPAPVELRKDQLDDPLGFRWITRQKVGRGLDKRTFPLSHSGVLLIPDRRHVSPL